MENQTTEPRTLLSGRAAAERIGCSRETVRRLAAAGRLAPAAVDGSGNNLYDPAVVDAFAATWIDGRGTDARRDKWERQRAELVSE